MFTGVFYAQKCRPKSDQKASVFGYHVRAGQEQRNTGTEPEKEDDYVWSDSWRYDRKPF